MNWLKDINSVCDNIFDNISLSQTESTVDTDKALDELQFVQKNECIYDYSSKNNTSNDSNYNISLSNITDSLCDISSDEEYINEPKLLNMTLDTSGASNSSRSSETSNSPTYPTHDLERIYQLQATGRYMSQQYSPPCSPNFSNSPIQENTGNIIYEHHDHNLILDEVVADKSVDSCVIKYKQLEDMNLENTLAVSILFEESLPYASHIFNLDKILGDCQFVPPNQLKKKICIEIKLEQRADNLAVGALL